MADPTVQQVNQYTTSIPQELAPYAQQMLGQFAGTMYNYAYDENNNVIKDETGMPRIMGLRQYQPYSGERNAQFTPLQQQSFTGAQNMQAAPQLQGASNIAGMASLGALGTNYNYTPQSGLTKNACGVKIGRAHV